MSLARVAAAALAAQPPLNRRSAYALAAITYFYWEPLERVIHRLRYLRQIASLARDTTAAQWWRFLGSMAFGFTVYAVVAAAVVLLVLRRRAGAWIVMLFAAWVAGSLAVALVTGFFRPTGWANLLRDLGARYVFAFELLGTPHRLSAPKLVVDVAYAMLSLGLARRALRTGTEPRQQTTPDVPDSE